MAGTMMLSLDHPCSRMMFIKVSFDDPQILAV
jgi:hypothetical protein